jgi:hypothetical protein
MRVQFVRKLQHQIIAVLEHFVLKHNSTGRR